MGFPNLDASLRVRLHAELPKDIVTPMKTASVQQLPEQWPQILRWVAAGEEVQVTQQDKVVAKVMPPTGQPDFLARARTIGGSIHQARL
jgi:antitoxin (DNA-binding transcriptional repressor) of toxin-antitoxin stability system